MAIPYYRWFPGDYARDTRHLSLMQHGVYRLLIDLYMDQNGPLRNDLPYLYRWLHAESVEEKNSVEFVLTEFFLLRDGRWFHKRCDAELSWRDGQSAAGKAAVQRREQARQNDRTSNGKRSIIDRSSNQNQNQNQNQISEPDSKSKPRKDKNTVAAFAAPAGISARLWADYVEHRKAKRAPLTPRAVELITAELLRMDDPSESLRQSIKNGWTGVFPPQRGRRNGIGEWLEQSERDITHESEREA